MNLLDQHIESLIFSAAKSISFTEIKKSIERLFEIEIEPGTISDALDRLKLRYEKAEYSFEIREIGQAYCFMTKPQFHKTIGFYLKVSNNKRLTKAALETLSIVAYRQPVTRIEIESIRGVNCEYTLHKLLEKELVEIKGRSDSPGRPLIYITSQKFMDYFGISELNDLPKLKDIVREENEIGEPAPIEEENIHEA